MNYQEWAQQYAEIVIKWGRQQTFMQGWVADLVNEYPDADPSEAWAQLHQLPTKQNA